MQQKYFDLLDELELMLDQKDQEDSLVDRIYDSVSKIQKTMEEVEKDVAILKKDSHAPQEFICCLKCGCKINKVKKK